MKDVFDEFSSETRCFHLIASYRYVRQKIVEFVRVTGSALGQSILDNWQEKHQTIVKVDLVSFCDSSF